jgi:hypothetical protein
MMTATSQPNPEKNIMIMVLVVGFLQVLIMRADGGRSYWGFSVCIRPGGARVGHFQGFGRHQAMPAGTTERQAAPVAASVPPPKLSRASLQAALRPFDLKTFDLRLPVFP